MAERPYNAADEKQVRAAQRAEALISQAQDDDFRWLLEQPQFRRFIWHLIAKTCGFLTSPLSNNGTLQSFSVGQQDIARALWARIESVDPLAIPRMMVEFHESKK